MKRQVITFIFLLIASLTFAQTEEIKTTMEFDETSFDFGTIEPGEKASHTYTFTNTGDAPLVIKNAKGSCGCTVPSWPKAPVMPGESGTIEVVFDSKGKKGKQVKRVTLTANTTPAQTFLTISGQINAGSDLPKFTYIPPNIKKATPAKWEKPATKDCVSIFPNPTSDIVKLEVKEHQGKKANINIFDANGKVMTNKVVNKITDELIEFNVMDYAPGHYYVNMAIGEKTIVTKCFIVAGK